MPVNSMMFVAVHGDGKGIHVSNPNLYQTQEEQPVCFYMHTFTI